MAGWVQEYRPVGQKGAELRSDNPCSQQRAGRAEGGAGMAGRQAWYVAAWGRARAKQPLLRSPNSQLEQLLALNTVAATATWQLVQFSKMAGPSTGPAMRQARSKGTMQHWLRALALALASMARGHAAQHPAAAEETRGAGDAAPTNEDLTVRAVGHLNLRGVVQNENAAEWHGNAA